MPSRAPLAAACSFQSLGPFPVVFPALLIDKAKAEGSRRVTVKSQKGWGIAGICRELGQPHRPWWPCLHCLPRLRRLVGSQHAGECAGRPAGQGAHTPQGPRAQA